MSEMNSTVTGYYNLYDSTKNYTELLFRAGKVLQSKEVNEIQSMLKNQIKNVGDTILTNGDIIEGCQLVIKGTEVTLTKGRIYLDGNVRSVEDTVLEITGEGTEVIGALLKSEVVTPDQDSTLLDVSTGFDNYNQDGAYRLKETVEITVNNNNASILYTLVDGQQLSITTSEDLTQLDKINATLARRTFDESGNYKVSGLKLVEKNYFDDSKIYLSLETGKAYVKGYEVSKTSATTFGLERPTDLKEVDNEPKVYRKETSQYALNNDYINRINKIVAIVQATQAITRGSIIGGVDYIPLTPVVEVLNVIQGETVYEQGVDFQVTNDGIDWSIGNVAPDPGSSYEVTWNYNKTLLRGIDYELKNIDGVGYVSFIEGGSSPVSGSTFLVNYNFTLCRRDIVSLDKDGKIVITKGQPDILRRVESPSVSDNSVLILGSVLLKPNTDEVQIINNNTQTIPMLDLYKMLERINDLEYNQSVTDLDNEAAEGENATELMGILTDGLLGVSKADTYHKDWTASIDLDNQELTLPFNTSLFKLSVDKDNDYNAGEFSRLLTAPYSEVTLLSQPLATGVLRVNSYNAFPKTPSVKLVPEIDNWIDENQVVVQGTTKTKTVTLRRWWYHKNASWAQQEKALWESYGLADGGESLGWNSTSVSTNKSIVNTILDEAIMYMRQTSVNVTVQNLEPYSDNITATFDGMVISLKPVESKYKGTEEGTLRADSEGKTFGQFEIPANTLCGTRELKIYPSNAPSLVGTANYTSNGRKVTTSKTVWTEVVRLNPTDPLAQSFQFDMDQYLTGVGIYFHDKAAVEPITVQVRNMVNGYPGTTCYAEKIIYPSEIVADSTGVTETKVVFDDPVYCNANTQYCFTVLSDSDVDSIFIAETAKTDISSNVQVSKNPYLNGNLFSSSNALTWTAHQSSDMKFNLYGAKFETTGHAVFKVIDSVSLDRLMITSEESIPTGCSINWKYSINGEDFNPIETYDDREIGEIAESVKIKVEITANSYTSPAIALDGLMLCGFSNAREGTYVSKNVYIKDGFNHVKQVVDIHVPVNTNVNMYYATDESGTTWKTLENTQTVQKSSEYKTYTFEDSLSNTAYNYRCKIELTTVDPISRPKVQNIRSIMKTI